MRFYLNFPLVAGYVLMATTACLGVLQLAAARGDYAGLALFTSDRKRGVRLGAGLTVGALLVYVLFAPEILTPGPAGTEVAELFAACALIALVITLIGAHRRLPGSSGPRPANGEEIIVGDLPATLSRPTSPPETSTAIVILLPDPVGLVTAPAKVTQALNQVGIAVLALEPQSVAQSKAPWTRRALLGHLSTALAQLSLLPGIDERRVGLLGLGLGGDAVLRAAAAVSQVAAALAVAPIRHTVPDANKTIRGLDWLCELSYFQAWRWRRQRPTLARAAAELCLADPKRGLGEMPVAVLQGRDDPLAAQVVGAEALTVPSRRHFKLLEDGQAQKATVSWFQERLEQNGGSV